MSNGFCLEKATSEILQSPDLLVRQNLDLENGTWDVGNMPAKIKGNITAGAVFRSPNSLVVAGKISGSERWPVRIKAEGDVIVGGDVQFAQIEARTIHIGGQSNQCRFKARKQIEIVGDLSEAHIVVGVHDLEIRNINRLAQLIKDQLSDKSYMERQLNLEEKRIYNLFHTTRIKLPTGLGQIIQHKRKKISINLQPLYIILSAKQDKDIDLALNEFFSKAVVGIFTKSNKEYLELRNNRKDIFLGAVRQFRHLFTLTRKNDRIVSQINSYEAQIQTCISELNEQRGSIRVNGKILASLVINFILPQIEYAADGNHVFHSDLASLEVSADPKTQKNSISRITVDQESSEEELVDSPLQSIVFGVYEGLPIWEPIDEKITTATGDQ